MEMCTRAEREFFGANVREKAIVLPNPKHYSLNKKSLRFK